ncbi:SMP-30/gluconolactonase/LRE family protein [Roseateles toxinivorans]|uniref:Sugar lactone lactonase YvrE n=1 Tax=Roseateles toxinivorans TaxID=270368 RepID=A0A4V3CSX4_9BURK|nr:SMP-30/gluconolactonase/LRE family protein [Roseateles toxinivorans]TDP62547.1 sugar lactone lactonase YvrE [Roseateles toxinivorans]
MSEALYQVSLAVNARARLGESPLWHPTEQQLYYVDIPACQVLRFDPLTQELQRWDVGSEVGCLAPLEGGGLLLAQRDGLWRLDTETGQRTHIAAAPYDTATQRFNDGKADPQGRFWTGTVYEPREPALAALYRYADGQFTSMVGEAVTANGLGWSPDGRTLYWTDTRAHTIWAFDFDGASGGITNRRVFASFAKRGAEQSLDDYGGRPDGAAVDLEGCYWVAMYEGQRLLQLSPKGELLREIALPVRCPTMPCFGGADLRTLYVTSASDKRPAEELAAQPWAGCVLQLRVETPGLPANFARLA